MKLANGYKNFVGGEADMWKRVLSFIMTSAMILPTVLGMFQTAFAAEDEVIFEEIYDATMNANNHNKNMVFSYFSAGSRNIATVGSHHVIRRWSSGQTCYFIYDALKKSENETQFAVKNKSFEVYTVQQSGHVDDVVIDYTTEAMPATLDNENISKLNWVKAEYTSGEAEVIPETASEAAPYYTVKYTSAQPLPENALYIRVHFAKAATWGAMYEGIRLVSEGAADDPLGPPRNWASDAVVTANVTESSAVISWPEISVGETGIQYRVTMDGKVLGDTADTAMNIDGLDAGTEHTISIEAYKLGKVISAEPLNGTFRTAGEQSVFRDMFSDDRKTTWKSNMASYEGNPLDANNPLNHSGNLVVLWRKADLSNQNASGQKITYTTDKINSLLGKEYAYMKSFTADFVRHTASGNMADVTVEYSVDGVTFQNMPDFDVADGGFVSDTKEYSYNSVHGILPDNTVALRISLAQANRRYLLSYGGINIDMAVADGYLWSENTELKVSDIQTDSAALSWSAVEPAEGNTIPPVYYIYVNETVAGTTSETSYPINNLNRNAKYAVYVVAKGSTDEDVISKKLMAADFRTDRKRGTETDAVIANNAVSIATTEPGTVVSAKAMISFGDVSVLNDGGSVTVGLKTGDNNWGNAYAKVYSSYTEYYKNGIKAVTLKHPPIHAGQQFLIDTDDGALPAGNNQFAADEGVTLHSVKLYTTLPETNEYYTAERLEITPEKSQKINLTETAPLENLSAAFTFEADITIPTNTTSTLAMRFYSNADYNGSKAKVADFNQTIEHKYGINGNLVAGYETAHIESTELYESSVWTPRIPNDGKSHALKLIVDFSDKSILMIRDSKVISELTLSNWSAAELASMEFAGNYVLENVKMRSGLHGFVYYPIEVVDHDGNKVSDLGAASGAELRLRVLNTEREQTVQLMSEQGNGTDSTFTAGEKTMISAKAEWQTLTVPVTVSGTAGRVKGFAWDSAAGMVPLAQSGGYIGTPETENKDKRLFLIGDSTVNYVSNPRVGWGEAIEPFLKENMSVYNFARDGKSSKTYWQSGRFDAMKPYMREGDYLVVQLAHNDRHADMEKGTTLEEYKSYLRKYIAEARRLGLHVLLVTPPTVQGDVGKTIEQLESEAQGQRHLCSYVLEMKKVAQELDVPLVDLYTKTIQSFPDEGVTSGNGNGIFYEADGTHFSQKGAEVLCGYLKELLNDSEMAQKTDLGKYFK